MAFDFLWCMDVSQLKVQSSLFFSALFSLLIVPVVGALHVLIQFKDAHLARSGYRTVTAIDKFWVWVHMWLSWLMYIANNLPRYDYALCVSLTKD
jgi:hypothetical protein